MDTKGKLREVSKELKRLDKKEAGVKAGLDRLKGLVPLDIETRLEKLLDEVKFDVYTKEQEKNELLEKL